MSARSLPQPLISSSGDEYTDFLDIGRFDTGTRRSILAYDQLLEESSNATLSVSTAGAEYIAPTVEPLERLSIELCRNLEIKKDLLDDSDVSSTGSIPAFLLRIRANSAPAVSRTRHEIQCADFLAAEHYPPMSEFKKKIRPNPEMDLVLQQPKRENSGASLSSNRSLKLTQVEKNFYFANVKKIFQEVLQEWFEDSRDIIANVIAVIMEFFENAKAVTFCTDDTEVFIVEAVGSEHRMLVPATHLLEAPNFLDIWNEKPIVTKEERKEAREIVADINFLTEFADAYL